MPTRLIVPPGLALPDTERDVARLPGTVLTSCFGFQDHGLPLLPPDIAGDPAWRAGSRVLLVILDGFAPAWYARSLPVQDFLLGSGSFWDDISPSAPPTTPVSLPAILTGERTGIVPEFGCLHRKTGRLIQSIPCRLEYPDGPEGEERDSLVVPAGRLLPIDFFAYRTTLYRELTDRGVPALAVTHAGYEQGTFADALYRGADRLLAYRSLAESASLAATALQELSGPGLVSLYCGDIDSAGHRFAPGAREHRETVADVLAAVQRIAQETDPATAAETITVITTDHGMEDVREEEGVFLDADPFVTRRLWTGQDGERGRRPSGAPLGCFLHTADEEAAEEVLGHINRNFAGKLWAVRPSRLVGAGVFGPDPRPEFVYSLGDVAVFGLPGYHARWQGLHPQRGNHGGLRNASLRSFLALSLLSRFRR